MCQIKWTSNCHKYQNTAQEEIKSNAKNHNDDPSLEDSNERNYTSYLYLKFYITLFTMNMPQ